MIYYSIRAISFLNITKMGHSLHFMALLSGLPIHRLVILLLLFLLKMALHQVPGKFLQMVLRARTPLSIPQMLSTGQWAWHKGRMGLYISAIHVKEKFGGLCIRV